MLQTSSRPKKHQSRSSRRARKNLKEMRDNPAAPVDDYRAMQGTSDHIPVNKEAFYWLHTGTPRTTALPNAKKTKPAPTNPAAQEQGQPQGSGTPPAFYDMDKSPHNSTPHRYAFSPDSAESRAFVQNPGNEAVHDMSVYDVQEIVYPQLFRLTPPIAPPFSWLPVSSPVTQLPHIPAGSLPQTGGSDTALLKQGRSHPTALSHPSPSTLTRDPFSPFVTKALSLTLPGSSTTSTSSADAVSNVSRSTPAGATNTVAADSKASLTSCTSSPVQPTGGIPEPSPCMSPGKVLSTGTVHTSGISDVATPRGLPIDKRDHSEPSAPEPEHSTTPVSPQLPQESPGPVHRSRPSTTPALALDVHATIGMEIDVLDGGDGKESLETERLPNGEHSTYSRSSCAPDITPRDDDNTMDVFVPVLPIPTIETRVAVVSATPLAPSPSTASIAVQTSSGSYLGLKRRRISNADDNSLPGAISPAKRPKITSATPYTKHAKHWAVDGNVLVQIQNVQFNLHRSRLAKHSGWFRKYFEDTTAVGDEMEMNVETEDDVEDIVYLDKIGIKVEDFEILLDALDNIVDYSHTKPPFRILSAVARTSTMLSFDKYSSWASRYLVNMWPAVLESVSTSQIPHALETLHLARKCSIPLILKRALYELVRVGGFSQGSAPGLKLSAEDYQTLVGARERLGSLWVTAAAMPSNELCTSVPRRSECTSRAPGLILKAHAMLVHTSGIFEKYMYDPVCGLQALMDAPWEKEKFCRCCVNQRRAVWKKEREAVWKNLDSWFGIGLEIGD